MRLAIVHDYLYVYGGAERALEQVHQVWPAAPIYTLLFVRDRLPPSFGKMDVRPTWVDRLPGRLALNALGDRVPRALVLAGILLSQAAALLILLGQQHLGWVAAFVLLYGAGFGAITPLRAALMADYFGRANYGSILAAQGLALAAARAAGPPLAGALRDITGTYGLALGLIAGLTALAAAGTLLAERARSHHRGTEDAERRRRIHEEHGETRRSGSS